MKKINLLFGLLAIAVLGFGFAKFSGDETPIGLNIGNKAPELLYKNPKDQDISLNKINKGKVVLIDFWASWCGPCRRENPNVVMAYKKYKDAKFANGAKGFTIYSVSLDKSKDQWVKAIEQDKLEWEYHVSDLMAWGSAAALQYNINSIPTNFLLDPNGIIVAKNLRGEDLEKEIEKMIGKKK